jgi:acylphosphatase
VIARGRVQGVGFRAATAHEARRLGLRGWVRNRLEGDVEVLAAGDATAIEALRTWLGHGPRGARVVGLDVDEAPSAAELENLEGFAIR